MVRLIAGLLIAATAVLRASSASAQYAQPPGSPHPAYGGPTYDARYDRSTHRDEHRRRKKPDDDTRASGFVDLLSLRVGGYRIEGSDADANTLGFLLAFDPDVVATEDYATARAIFYGAIGGGSDGFEGELELSSTGGVRGYLGDDHGPFARIGLGLQFLGNNKIYRSFIQLPEAHLGYQFLDGNVLFEVAGTGGLILGGRYFTGDHAERRIDTEPSFGGLATLQLDGFRLHASALRILASQTGPGTPVDQARVQGCVSPVEIVFLCANGAFHRGDVELPTGGFRESTAVYVGGTIGIGLIETLPK